MTAIKFFTKESLIAAAKAGNERGYNRQLDPEKLADLQYENWLPVTFDMIHEHIAGNPVEPHRRVVVLVGEDGEQVTLDISQECFDSLPDYDPAAEALQTDDEPVDGGHRRTTTK